MKNLGDAEFEIMEVLWSVDEPVTVSYITEHLKTRSHWKISTVLTVLARLTEKGLVDCDRTKRRNLYTAIMTEKQYKADYTKMVVDKLYHNSLSAMVTNWIENETIADEDIEELQKIVDRVKDKKK